MKLISASSSSGSPPRPPSALAFPQRESVHLDATSFHLYGRYDDEGKEDSEEIRITYRYSREHRPELKQFVVDLMSTGDGGVPLFLRVANAKEADQAVFAELLRDFPSHGWISTHCLWRTERSLQ